MNTNRELGLKPLATFWFKPIKTVSQILDYNPVYMGDLIPGLLVLSGIPISLLRNGQTNLFGLILSIIVGFVSAIALIFFIQLYGGIMNFICKKLNGVGSFEKTVTVITWSLLPVVFYDVVLTIAFIMNLANPSFLSYTLKISLILLLIIIVFWGYIISIRCLSIVQKFSLWKAMIAVTGTWLLTVSVVFGILTVFMP